MSGLQILGVPSSVVTSSLKELGEVEGNVTPNMSEGRVFTMTAKGNLTIKKPTNWPAGVTYAELKIQENSEGGKTITLEGVTWLSGEPVFNTAANAINTVQLVSYDGGTHWFAFGPEKGATGATGPTGPEAIGTGRLLRSKCATYKETGAATTEARQVLAESISRNRIGASQLLVSGTPIAAAIEVPAKTKYKGLGVYVVTAEGTPANRTHLCVALLNEKLEVLKRSLDFTSSTNTPMSGSLLRGIPFSEEGESGSSAEVLYGIIWETMSSTNPITIGSVSLTSALNELLPRIAFLGETGRTEPSSLASTVVPSASTGTLAYMALV